LKKCSVFNRYAVGGIGSTPIIRPNILSGKTFGFAAFFFAFRHFLRLFVSAFIGVSWPLVPKYERLIPICGRVNHNVLLTEILTQNRGKGNKKSRAEAPLLLVFVILRGRYADKRADKDANGVSGFRDLVSIRPAPNGRARDVKGRKSRDADKRYPLQNVVNLVVQFHLRTLLYMLDIVFYNGYILPDFGKAGGVAVMLI
jgi:hypothetical protein